MSDTATATNPAEEEGPNRPSPSAALAVAGSLEVALQMALLGAAEEGAQGRAQLVEAQQAALECKAREEAAIEAIEGALASLGAGDGGSVGAWLACATCAGARACVRMCTEAQVGVLRVVRLRRDLWRAREAEMAAVGDVFRLGVAIGESWRVELASNAALAGDIADGWADAARVLKGEVGWEEVG